MQDFFTLTEEHKNIRKHYNKLQSELMGKTDIHSKEVRQKIKKRITRDFREVLQNKYTN